MKKIVALGAIAALACGMVFADEPAIDIKVAELSGSASVKWGVDLDAGQHGFSNEAKTTLKINLWNEGTKETTSDDAIGGGDVWAEIQVKGKSAAFKSENGKKAEGLDGDACATLETAKLHIGENFYIDIKSGDLRVGEYKPDAALHADKAWLDNFGWNWSNGIEAGWDDKPFKFSLGFRSASGKGTDYTSAYGFKLAAELKDGDDALVPGLSVAAGFGMNLSTDIKETAGSSAIDGESDKNTQADLNKHKAAILDWDKPRDTDQTLVSWIDPTDLDAKKNPKTVKIKNLHDMTYGIKAAYKLAIGDDGMYLKPSVGFEGDYATGTVPKGTPRYAPTEDKSFTKNWNKLAFGVLFGWGDMKDAAAGVPFLNDNGEKKVTPGVGVVAYIPLPTTVTVGDTKAIFNDSLKALIVPSFYLGDDKVEGLKAAVYSEIGLYTYIKEAADRSKKDGNTTTYKGSIDKENETFAFALAAGLSYGLKVEDYTITPSAGFRYANGAYVSNGLPGKYSDIFKTNLGFQKAPEDADTALKQKYAADFFNLKIGCDFGGFINNTVFSVNYTSANLLNGISTDAKSSPKYAEDTKYYNVKAGQFDVGCKISL